MTNDSTDVSATVFKLQESRSPRHILMGMAYRADHPMGEAISVSGNDNLRIKQKLGDRCTVAQYRARAVDGYGASLVVLANIDEISQQPTTWAADRFATYLQTSRIPYMREEKTVPQSAFDAGSQYAF